MSAPSITVVGRGRLGHALQRALGQVGRPAELVSHETPSLGAPDWVFLCVPDAAITPVSATLSLPQGSSVIHCSGALSLEALEDARHRGHPVGCFHPNQSFADHKAGLAHFQGITIGIEADPSLGEGLQSLAEALGSNWVRLEGVDRARYHAAAVFASNYLVALMASAEQAWVEAGLPPHQARSALLPLSGRTLDNLAQQSPAQALTGPIARGDVETVARHLQALAERPELARLYRELARPLLELELGLPQPVLTELRRLLGSG